MKEKLIIRVDGSEKIGMGHLVRCLALAEMIKYEFVIEFACLFIPKETAKEFNNLNYIVRLFSNESEFIDSIEKNNLILIDGYQFDTNYQISIKRKNAFLICIDDLHNKEFFCDLLINHSVSIKKSEYKAQNYTTLALGTDYSLLRKPFLEQASKPRSISEINSVLICFGGSDEFNLTELSLKVAIEYREFKRINVITGVAYKHLYSLKKLIFSDKRINHFSGLTDLEMRNEMLKSDLAIAPGSGILYELLSCKNIVITGQYVENQKIFIKNISKFKNVININVFNEKNIKYGIKRSFALKHSNENFIDGNSGKRIAELIKNIKKTYYFLTGCSKGIGLEIKNELIKDKNNFIIGFSRNIEKEKNNIKNFSHIKIDLSKQISKGLYSKLKNKIPNGHDIVFINNAASIEPIKDISNLTEKEIIDSIMLNVLNPVNISVFLLSNFKNNKITFVNIGSGASNKSIPHWSLYSSAKAYMIRFYEILQKENETNSKIKFINVDPGLVDTGMQKSIRESDSPDRARFQQAKMSNKLQKPKEVALSIISKIQNQ